MEYIDPMVETVKDFGRITGVMEHLDKYGWITPEQALERIRKIIKANSERPLEVLP